LSLKKQTFSAVRWTSLAMIGKAALGFLQLAILARVLAPADFGLMALVVAVVGFSQIFTDMGVSNAIIHHQEISQEELSSLYWLNVSAGGILMLLLMAVSSPIASFFQEPLLQPLLVVVSVTFLISALGQQLIVIAEKNLQFTLLTKIELASSIAGFVTAVTWICFSPAVIAIVAGLIASSLTMTMLSWLFLAKGWAPQLRLKVIEIRHFLSFGGFTMADNFVNTFNRQADVFIGGRMLPIDALGFYSLPRNLSIKLAGVINPIVTRVGLPVMAKVQHDALFLKNVYLKTLRMTASVNFPLYLAVATFAPEIITLLFGDQWQESIPLLRIFALWGLLRSKGNPIGSLLYATGRADFSFKWNMTLFFITPPTIWFASQWGSMGVALALLGVQVILYIPGWFFLVRPLCGATLWEYTLNLIIPLAASIIASVVAYLSVSLISDAVIRLMIGGVTGGIGYIFISMWINKEWAKSMKELVLNRWC
jgi:O-antigen/teichoic acid export membrane protein